MTLDSQHLLNQFVAGICFGVAAGFCANRGLFSASNIISVSLFVLTFLDHFGYMQVPWGWHGSYPARIGTLGDLLYEIFQFCINNFVVYLTFLLFYSVTVGRIGR